MPTKARTALAEIQPNDTSTDLELQKALDKVTSEGYEVYKSICLCDVLGPLTDYTGHKETDLTQAQAECR